MPLHTQQSLSGFIASEPRLTVTDRGDTRFYAKIGQEHYHRNPDGSFTQLETTFHDLVLYRRTAERAHAAFSKGDKFVAEGYVHTYEYLNEFGQTKTGEEFVAKKIGHDTARTTYSVDRTPPSRDEASLDNGQIAAAEPERSTPAEGVSL
ncbi:single-stranded DNA-binding protein [Jiangella muralis]|uniref:single-stranded DNA-binding protein n=1 Tax=Jiangella muralis TaxID=702383 RepID=UPI00069DA0DA|nr:single-stranded DNA-binding protein [Jiangella muralis]